MRFLFLGDVVGASGRKVVLERLPGLRRIEMLQLLQPLPQLRQRLQQRRGQPLAGRGGQHAAAVADEQRVAELGAQAAQRVADRGRGQVQALRGAAQVLLDRARAIGADLLVLGPHEKRLLIDFGSTARAVLAKATCAVATAGGSNHAATARRAPVRNRLQHFGIGAISIEFAQSL